MKKIAADRNYTLLKEAGQIVSPVDLVAIQPLIDEAARVAVGEYMHGDGGDKIMANMKRLSSSTMDQYSLDLIRSLKRDIGKLKGEIAELQQATGIAEAKRKETEAKRKERKAKGFPF